MSHVYAKFSNNLLRVHDEYHGEAWAAGRDGKCYGWVFSSEDALSRVGLLHPIPTNDYACSIGIPKELL